MSVQGRVDRWFKAHPAAAALVGVVLLGTVVVMDGARLWRAYDRGDSHAGVAIAAGVLASLGVSVFVWRAVRARRANPRRRRFPWTGVVVAVTLIAFILTHPRRGDQPVLTTPLALAVVSYIVGGGASESLRHLGREIPDQARGAVTVAAPAVVDGMPGVRRVLR